MRETAVSAVSAAEKNAAARIKQAMAAMSRNKGEVIGPVLKLGGGRNGIRVRRKSSGRYFFGQHRENGVGRNAVGDEGLADAAREHEPDLPVAHLLVVAHVVEQRIGIPRPSEPSLEACLKTDLFEMPPH